MSGSSNDGPCIFDEEYEEILELDSGRRVRLAPLGPEDRETLERGFERLSTESRYRRFLAPKSKLTEAELGYLTEVDQHDHLAIGATIVGGETDGAGVGVARCIRLEQAPTIAEAAVTVVDEFQGMGLGSQLLERLVVAARERGIETFRATLLAENKPMRVLLEKIGEVEVVERSGSVVTVDVSLPGTEPPEAEPPNVPAEVAESPLGRILSLTARGLATLADKLRNLPDEKT